MADINFSKIKKSLNSLQWHFDEMLGIKRTEDVYNKIAKGNKYEYLLNYSSRVGFLRKVVKKLDPIPTSVLDLACGTGALIEALPNLHSTRVVGVDISRGMLDIAKKKFRDYPSVKLMKVDFMKASFPKSDFDLISMAYAMRFIPKGKEKDFVHLVSRWLHRNGVFLIINSRRSYGPFFDKIYTKLYKGFNTEIIQEKKMVQFLSPEFYLVKKIPLTCNNFPFITAAYYFKKLQIKKTTKHFITRVRVKTFQAA